jgi:hypothetical protein
VRASRSLWISELASETLAFQKSEATYLELL